MSQIETLVDAWVSTWRPKPNDPEYTLIVGNLRGFYAWLAENGYLAEDCQLGRLWEVLYAARELEEYLGVNSDGVKLDIITKDGETADKLTALLDDLQTKVKAVKLNPVTREDYIRFSK